MPKQEIVDLITVAHVIAAIAVFLEKKKRSPNGNKLSTRDSAWKSAQEDIQLHQWFNKKLRMSKESFNLLYNRVSQEWPRVHELPAQNAFFRIKDRLAVALYYLTHECSYDSAASVFGMSKSSVIRYVDQIVCVLILIAPDVIQFPSNIAELDRIAEGFEVICQFPQIIGAVDGTLIKIKRFADHDGWYCRKFYPAFNVQAVVKHNKQFVSYSIRNGSQNDQGIFNRSEFGRNIAAIVPPGYFILADAGYRLLPNLLTPYPIIYNMDARKSRLT